MMLTIARAVKLSAIALGLTAFSLNAVNAQTYGSDFNFNRIELGTDTDWSFSSEDETASIEDNLSELQDYSISNLGDFNIRINDEEPRWSNRGDIEDFYIDADIYDY